MLSTGNIYTSTLKKHKVIEVYLNKIQIPSKKKTVNYWRRFSFHQVWKLSISHYERQNLTCWECGRSWLSRHVGSSQFIGTSHRRLKQWYWSGWKRKVKILNVEVYKLQVFGVKMKVDKLWMMCAFNRCELVENTTFVYHICVLVSLS